MEMELVGLRVIRGKDWNSDDVDGGEGHVGTIVNVGGLQTVDVVWDNGRRNTCRIGQSGKYDLKIFDNGTVGVRHTGYSCIVCSQQDICGMRWRCTVCKDCNLCPLCYVTDKHDIHHEFTRFVSPGDPGTKVGKRSIGFKVQSLGIFPGAIVKRGQDWKWDNQDGGDGKTGEVLKVKDHNALKRCLLNIKWTATGKENTYRLGVGGYVDVQFVQESRGIFYYRDHLPDCKKISYDPSQSSTVNSSYKSEDLKEGDTVCIKVSEQELESLQREHDVFIKGMSDCIGKVGEIKSCAPNGLVMVEFDQLMFRFYPGVLKKTTIELQAESIQVGDKVRILSKKSTVKSLQENHGGYISAMDELCGKVGLVVQKIDNRLVRVQFGDTQFVYNPACCEKAPGETVYEAQDIRSQFLGGLGLGMFGMISQLSDASSAAILLKAISEGHSDQAISIIRQSPSTVNVEIQGLTPLILACNQGDKAVVDELLNKGAKINALEKKGNSTLTSALASEKPNRQIAKMLIERGVNVNIIPDSKVTASHLAAYRDFDDVLVLMIQRGCNVNVKDEDGDTPIHLALQKGNDECVKTLCRAANIDMTVTNNDGFTPIAIAALRNRPWVMESMLNRNKSTVNTGTPEGHTPMHIAAINGHTDCARILLRQGNADVNKRNNDRFTPLHMACDEGYDETVKLLIENNADVHALNTNDDTPLHLTLLNKGGLGNLSHMLQTLMRGQVSSTKRGNRLQIAKMLMNKGASLSKRNVLGLTPLDMCSDQQLKDAVINISGQRTGQEIPFMSQVLCIRCKSEKADIELKPCDHTCLCASCALEVEKCPRCESRIERRLRHRNKSGQQIPSMSQLFTATGMCIRCKSEKADIEFKPCDHTCLCAPCALKVEKCPRCESHIERRLRHRNQSRSDEIPECQSH